MLAEARVKLPVPIECSIDTDLIASAQLTDTGLEQILFDGPAHEVVGDGGLRNLLIEQDSFVVILAFERNKIGGLQP